MLQGVGSCRGRGYRGYGAVGAEATGGRALWETTLQGVGRCGGRGYSGEGAVGAETTAGVRAVDLHHRGAYAGGWSLRRVCPLWDLGPSVCVYLYGGWVRCGMQVPAGVCTSTAGGGAVGSRPRWAGALRCTSTGAAYAVAHSSGGWSSGWVRCGPVCFGLGFRVSAKTGSELLKSSELKSDVGRSPARPRRFSV